MAFEREFTAIFKSLTAKFQPNCGHERHSLHLSDHLIRFTLSHEHDKKSMCECWTRSAKNSVETMTKTKLNSCVHGWPYKGDFIVYE